MSETPLDRLRSAVQSVVRSLVPELDYSGHYEYVVVSCDGTKLSGRPADESLGLPELSDVPVQMGVVGGSSLLTPGTTCLVIFVNKSPTKPRVVAGDPSALPISTHVDATLAAAGVRIGDGVLPVARAGDLAGGFLPVVTTQVKTLA